MARYLIPLDATIKAVRSGDPRKRLSLTDGDGLYPLIFVKGGAHGGRLDYTFEGRRKTLSLGTYLLHHVGDRSAQGRCSA